MKKNWYQSKYIWFGILFVITGIAGLFGFNDFTPDSTWLEYGEIINGLIIIGLRMYTNKKIA